jgi:hypothetical protein
MPTGARVPDGPQATRLCGSEGSPMKDGWLYRRDRHDGCLLVAEIGRSGAGSLTGLRGDCGVVGFVVTGLSRAGRHR